MTEVGIWNEGTNAMPSWVRFGHSEKKGKEKSVVEGQRITYSEMRREIELRTCKKEQRGATTKLHQPLDATAAAVVLQAPAALHARAGGQEVQHGVIQDRSSAASPR